jgi:hypothetical protein
MEVRKGPPSLLAFAAILSEEITLYPLVMGWMTFRAHMDVVTKKETQASLT